MTEKILKQQQPSCEIGSKIHLYSHTSIWLTHVLRCLSTDQLIFSEKWELILTKLTTKEAPIVPLPSFCILDRSKPKQTAHPV